MDCIRRYDSPLGPVTLSSDGGSLTGLWFDGQRHFGSSLLPAPPSATSASAVSAPSDFEDLLAAGYVERSLPVFDQTCRWLDIYFSGKEPDFTPPILLRGTPFQLSVWSELLRIPFGCTVTYGAIAASLSSATLSSLSLSSASLASASPASPSLVSATPSVSHPSARAVGGAVGRNPISLIVPCHRVVGAAGRRTGASVGPTMVGPLTGYAGGLDRKLRLLELEGVIL